MNRTIRRLSNPLSAWGEVETNRDGQLVIVRHDPLWFDQAGLEQIVNLMRTIAGPGDHDVILGSANKVAHPDVDSLLGEQEKNLVLIVVAVGAMELHASWRPTVARAERPVRLTPIHNGDVEMTADLRLEAVVLRSNGPADDPTAADHLRDLAWEVERRGHPMSAWERWRADPVLRTDDAVKARFAQKVQMYAGLVAALVGAVAGGLFGFLTATLAP